MSVGIFNSEDQNLVKLASNSITADETIETLNDVKVSVATDKASVAADKATVSADKADIVSMKSEIANTKTTIDETAQMVSENADSVKQEKIAIDETKTDIDKKYTEISNTATKLNTEYNNLTSNYYTKEATNSLISSTTKPKYSVVNELPTSDISTDIIYLKSTNTTSTDGIYEMYTYQDSNWVKIGTSNPDLADYYTKELADSIFATKTEINNTNSNVSQLKEDLEKQPNLFKPTIGLNKLDNSLLVDGKRVLSNGTIGDLESACATEEYIEISQENGNYIALYTCMAETGNPHTCCYATAFYDVNKAFISQTRLSGVPVNKGDCRIEIPSAAKYIRTSFIKNTRFKYMCIFGSADMELKNYESYHCKEPYPIPNDLDEKLNNLEILSENFSKKDYPVHRDNAEFTITKLRNSFTFNQNDFTFVKDELWLAKHNPNDFSNGTGIFRHKWDGEQFVHIGTINCDFGHWNVVDYCEANDCLIFGNGANDFETEGNYFVVVPHPLELGDTALIADVGIKYNVDIGYKVQALWGDSNLGENNIAVLLSNDLKTIVKVLLKRDSSGNFNGEFIELEREENLPAFGIQGADIWDNTLYVGGAESSGMYTINKVSLSNYSSVKNSVKYYKDDGTPYLGVVQGVYVGGDYVWVFVNTDAPQTGKCCFLTKYRR